MIYKVEYIIIWGVDGEADFVKRESRELAAYEIASLLDRGEVEVELYEVNQVNYRVESSVTINK